MDLKRWDLEQQLCSSALTFARAVFPDAEIEIALLLCKDNSVQTIQKFYVSPIYLQKIAFQKNEKKFSLVLSFPFVFVTNTFQPEACS